MLMSSNASALTTDRRNHDLYRMRDLSGRLLYIGVTNGGLRRFMEHAKDKTWWREVSTIDVEHVHCSRSAIELLEREAIQNERPLYNVVHNVAPTPQHAGSTAAPWPRGTEDVADILDRIGAPLDVTQRAARKAILDGNHRAAADALRAAIRYRQERAAIMQFAPNDRPRVERRPAPIDPSTGRAQLGGFARPWAPPAAPTGGEG
jgi:predicted GIY-YIG superfamily endonuclease